MLDSVETFAMASANNGTATLIGRRIGTCQLLHRRGGVYRSKLGYHSHTLFPKVDGSSRYNWHKRSALAHSTQNG